jgi:hypothetical protein
MAQTSWPFENIDTTETQFSQWARNIGEGVIKNAGNELEPFADSTGMVVKVRSGQALVRGHYYDNTAEVSLTVPTADLADPRIDAIVLRLDPIANSVALAIVEGTPDASPVEPTLTQTDSDVYEFLLGYIDVTPATANIAPEDVTDERGTLFERDQVNRANGTVSEADETLTVVRNITLSTGDPTGGVDGEVWLKYD